VKADWLVVIAHDEPVLPTFRTAEGAANSSWVSSSSIVQAGHSVFKPLVETVFGEAIAVVVLKHAMIDVASTFASI